MISFHPNQIAPVNDLLILGLNCVYIAQHETTWYHIFLSKYLYQYHDTIAISRLDAEGTPSLVYK